MPNWPSGRVGLVAVDVVGRLLAVGMGWWWFSWVEVSGFGGFAIYFFARLYNLIYNLNNLIYIYRDLLTCFLKAYISINNLRKVFYRKTKK